MMLQTEPSAATLRGAVLYLSRLTYKDFRDLAGILSADADKMVEGIDQHLGAKQQAVTPGLVPRGLDDLVFRYGG